MALLAPKKNASDWSAQDGVILADGKGKHSYLLWHEDDLADEPRYEEELGGEYFYENDGSVADW